MKILFVIGTRPEAIKLAPVIIALRNVRTIETVVCVTAQHRKMLDDVLKLFSIVPDIDLNIMTNNQSLAEITSKIISGIDRVFQEIIPDLVMIQGDTTTVMATAVSAFYRGIKIGHVEAGLRSGNISSPFPEELNRRIAGIVSCLHFAPTMTAVNALKMEGVPECKIFLTGNTVIDALNLILSQSVPDSVTNLMTKAAELVEKNKLKIILVTAHRRENFGDKFENICHGIKTLVQRNKDIVVIFPVHPNPNVNEPVRRILSNIERIILTDPLEYNDLAHVMQSSYLVLTDSGGIQEEAPSLGKPVLVMRTETERPEGVLAGTAILVGPDEEKIIVEAENLLRNQDSYNRMAQAVNPYGDGHAAEKIIQVLINIAI